MPKTLTLSSYPQKEPPGISVLCQRTKIVDCPFNYSGKNNTYQQQRQQRKLVSRLIENVYDNGPAGLLHLRLLSRILNCGVRVWIGNRLIRSIGRCSAGRFVDVEYRANRAGRPGHWCLRGGREPQYTGSLGDCLYAVLTAQTGWDAAELRRRVAAALRRDRRVLRASEAAVLLGGAIYRGNSPNDARRILDDSQTQGSHPDGQRGHPRGHASYPNPSGGTDSVEAYSYGRWRSGFMSREDQDLVAHYAFLTDDALGMMDRLNNGGTKVDAHIGRNNIEYDPLPLCSIWDKGQQQGQPRHLSKVVLVGKHFLNRNNQIDSPVFVLTFYPVL